jgi:hypothetical protein
MTSSSNSSSLALVTLPNKRKNYDVFVTFRGEDTRNNISDFLFNALEDKGVYIFRDDTMIWYFVFLVLRNLVRYIFMWRKLKFLFSLK